jgi:mRNA-degrading endonuclease RelE of RelBE toxin-antitoxin system
MEQDPFSGDVRRLQGQPGLWRRRVGDWRILFSPDRAARVIDVAAIVRRTTTTY